MAEDLREMELEVDVDEADVGSVEAGQPATFTVDAYPDRRYTAHGHAGAPTARRPPTAWCRTRRC